MIEDYHFGEVKVSGQRYQSDVIIYPDHIDDHWWRKQGHRLELEDIKKVVEMRPDVIVIGTGNFGLMQVEKNTLEQLRKMNIQVIILPTVKACQEYNKIYSQKKVVACLHLTC